MRVFLTLANSTCHETPPISSALSQVVSSRSFFTVNFVHILSYDGDPKAEMILYRTP